MSERPDDLAPETVNNEQDDADTQAQSVASAASGRSPRDVGIDADSDKSPSDRGAVVDDDVEDLVDHMFQMDTSGVIDMSAYRGEETMDDLENRYGQAGVADEDFKDDDS